MPPDLRRPLPPELGRPLPPDVLRDYARQVPTGGRRAGEQGAGTGRRQHLRSGRAAGTWARDPEYYGALRGGAPGQCSMVPSFGGTAWLLLLRARHGTGLRPGAVPRPVRCLLGQARFRRILWRLGVWPAWFLRARDLGAFLEQASSTWCRQLAARLWASLDGASYWRHGVVPAIAGTVWCHQLTARCTVPLFGDTVCRRRIRRRTAEPPGNCPAAKARGGRGKALSGPRRDAGHPLIPAARAAGNQRLNPPFAVFDSHLPLFLIAFLLLVRQMA